MKIRGVYYNLIEQQNLYHSNEKNNNYPLSSTSDMLLFPRKRSRRSSILSFTSSLISVLYNKRNSNHNEKQIEDFDEIKKSNTTWKILKMNKPEWVFILIGCFAALINGTLEPTSAIVQTKLVTVMKLN